jgi:uncharacterized protein YjbI with pentapeptide repeats
VIGADLRNARANGTNFQGSDLRGIDFAAAQLHDANFRDARLCSQGARIQSTRSRDGIDCGDFSGANVRGADFRGALICNEDNAGSRTCRPVDAATLRSHSGSNLDGATLP